MVFFLIFFHFKAVLEAHSRGQRHTRRLRVLQTYTSKGVDICQADHSVEDQLKLGSLLEELNSEDLLLDGLNFLRVFLGRVWYRYLLKSSGVQESFHSFSD